MEEKTYLYKITIQGLVGTRHKVAMVVAGNSGDAYIKYREVLDELNIGYHEDRALESVEAIAEIGDSRELKMRLML